MNNIVARLRDVTEQNTRAASLCVDFFAKKWTESVASTVRDRP
jgi:hypothetical protein